MLKGNKGGIQKESLQELFGLSREDHESKEDKIWDTLMKEADTNKDGIIDQEEFFNIMQQLVSTTGKNASM